MDPVVWLVITWATFSPHRTTAALEKIPQANLQQCSENAERISKWQPKASAMCIEGISGF
jgi:hypothetical protein